MTALRIHRMESSQGHTGVLWKLLVEARAPEPFFQVLVVRAASVEDAIDRVRQYLERDGSRLFCVDDEETAVVTLDDPPAAWILPSPTAEGVVAAAGRIFFPEPLTGDAALKAKTALKRSQVASRMLAIALPLTLVAFLYLRRWQLGAIAGVMSVCLVMALLNVSRIRDRLGDDPT